MSVHPRLRGELVCYMIEIIFSPGSSPLTRGTHNDPAQFAEAVRFIPAYAGNSLKDGINPSIHTLGI